MKKSIFKYTGLFLWVFAVFLSCKKRDIDMLYAVPSPQDVNIITSKEKAEIGWSYSDERAQSFTIELSEAATFNPILAARTVKADSIYKVLFTGLKSKATYYVRLRTLTGDPIIDSRYNVVSFASAEIENIFLAFGVNDVKATSAVLTWKAPAEGTVSHLIVTPVGGTALPQINLTPAQVTARTIEVTDLVPAKNYKAEIFAGTERKGITEFKTKDLGAAITINNATQEYATLAEAITAAVSGDIIKLTTGTYDYAGQTLTISGKSLTFQAKTATDIPVVKLRNFALSGDIGVLKFSGLTIQSAIIAGASDYEKHIFGGTYVSGSLDLQLENCNLSGAESGLFFTQTVGAASAPSPIPGTGSFSVVVTNCLLHDFGNAGGDFIDFRSGAVAKALVKNTTFWNGARAFLRIDNTASVSPTSVLGIENSTLYNFCSGGAFVRLQAANVDAKVTKCILVNKASATNNSLSNGAKATLDQNNLFGSNITNIRSVVTNTNETQLDPSFANAATADFKVGNATLKAAGIGDPRWLQ
jgi:hypothetical protein